MNKPKPLLIVVLIVALLVLNAVIWRAALTPDQSSAPVGGATSSLPALLPTSAARPTLLPTRPPTPRSASPTARPATPTASATARPTSSPADTVLTSLDAVIRAAEAGRRNVPFRLAFTEQWLTQELTTYLSANPDLSFSDVTVTLQPGEALITGKAMVLNFNVGFKATADIVIEDGRPRLRIRSLDLSGGLVPGFLKDPIIQMIERSTDLSFLGDLPVLITEVIIERGQAIVVGRLT